MDRLFGRNAVRESLLADRRLHRRLIVAANVASSPRITEIITLARRYGVSVEEMQRTDLDSIVRGNHQGVLLETSRFPYSPDLELGPIAQRGGLVLALDQIQDPRNLGSLLRTAEATQVDAVVMPTDRSARITPATVNASAGASEHLVIRRETNLARWIGRAKNDGFWVAGLDAVETSTCIFEADITLPLVLVVGSEGSGLRRLVREACDYQILIPMYGRIASLNAAVAGSIALYEIREFSTKT